MPRPLIRIMLVVAFLASGGCAASSPTNSSPALHLPTLTTDVPVHIDGEAMSPTLPNGTMALADPDAYAMHLPQRGDLVVMHPPNDLSRTLVQRIIALPGDIVQIDRAQNAVAILIEVNGQPPFQRLMETYLPEAWTVETFCCLGDGTASATATPVTIPSLDYFVLGDNRNRSSDSRMFGFVPAVDIVGKVVSIEGSSANLYANRPALIPS